MEIGQLIKNRRKELKLTLKQVARYCNVSESTVSRWETGDIENMKRDKIYLLSKILYLPIPIILGFEEEIIPSNIVLKKKDIFLKLDNINDEQVLDQIDKIISTFKPNSS